MLILSIYINIYLNVDKYYLKNSSKEYDMSMNYKHESMDMQNAPVTWFSSLSSFYFNVISDKKSELESLFQVFSLNKINFRV